jgi:hypothetical protein
MNHVQLIASQISICNSHERRSEPSVIRRFSFFIVPAALMELA